MAVKKYRKVPVVIEACQWVGENFNEIYIFMDYYDQTPRLKNGVLTLLTLEGLHIVNQGDYIIKGVKDEFYPCKPDIFEMTYEEVCE